MKKITEPASATIQQAQPTIGDDFKKTIKIGVFKELHKSGIISASELSALIAKQNLSRK